MNYRIGIIIIFLIILNSVCGQVSQNFKPVSTLRIKQKPDLFISIKSFDKDNKNISNDKLPFYAGYTIPFAHDDMQKGRWDKTSGSWFIWRLGITVPDVEALNVYFKNFNLRNGDRIFIYNPEMNKILGAFTKLNNDDYLGTTFIQGDSLVIEYNTRSLPDSLPFLIQEIGISVNDNGNQERDFGDSEDCEVLVNCPEGDDFQDEKRGVARVLVKDGTSLFWCSGSLVNNTNRDGKPYFLTAHHCGETSSADDYSKWMFYFNFESTDCEIPLLEPEYQSISGAKLIADGEKTSIGSDFKLLLLNEDLPKDYHPYYNGWDRSDVPSEHGVGIHHPEGDIKMISTYTKPLVSTNYNSTEPDQNGQFWQVYWSETTSGHGVTEGGSSGSPLFNSDGNIVGTLSGGRASCSHLGFPDYYGKFSEHWENNGNDSSSQLKPWLDPIGSDVPTLRGLDLDTTELIADFDSYNTRIRVGDGVQFNNKSLGDITDYKWEFKGGDPEFSESAIPPVIYYRKIGEYDVKLTVKSHGDIDSLVIKNYVRVLPNIYPNPSKNGVFYLVFGKAVPDDIEITIYNSIGQTVQFKAQASNGNIMAVDLSGLPQGMYLIKVRSNSNIQVIKIGNKIIS